MSSGPAPNSRNEKFEKVIVDETFVFDPTQEPGYFHKLINIENYPEFLPIAKKLAVYYLSQADFSADPGYAEFDYTEDAFDQRMKAIYEDLMKTAYDPYWMDSGLLLYRDEAGKEQTYPVGRMSDRAVIEKIKQFAPFNLVDGAWLNNILTVGPSKIVQSHLFAIWDDEAGNGDTNQNHANVYDALLRSVNIYLPPITSTEFLDSDFLPGAFTGSVFELCVGRFAKEFFPELLGMTLQLEWEATPTLQTFVSLLAGRKINPQFYRLHVAIDNITAGHGFLAKEAIKLYLSEIREAGGDAAVAAQWKRIWNGYVTWATLGGLGNELIERYLVLDKKTINLSSDPTIKKCWPDIKGFYRNRMMEVVRSKAPVAAEVHRGVSVNGRALASLFSDPGLLLDNLVQAGYVNPEYPRDSKFLALLAFDGPMYKIFTDHEKNIILDWIESLRAHPQNCVDPIVHVQNPEGPPERMAELIASHASEAEGAHAGIVFTSASGQLVPLPHLFSSPAELMGELVNCGWVVPGDPARSIFLSRLASNGGPMDGVFSADEIKTISNWISDGAKQPEKPLKKVMLTSRMLETASTLAKKRHLIGAGSVH